MRLYHVTPKGNVPSILREGLLPSGFGIVYLSPSLEAAKSGVGWRPTESDAILEVETGDLKLTAFEDCREWEVLCWGKIPPACIVEVKPLATA